MNTILITGGAGFIGSHLCERLLIEGNNAIIIDNFNDFYDPSIKENNLKEIQCTMNKNSIPENRLIIYKSDIRDKVAMDDIFNKNKIDIVVHLAAMAGVRPSIDNPELYYDVNINGTLNLLEQCRQNKIDKFVFASSSSVYGNNKKIPFSEDDIVDNPISPYASTKKSGELLCYTYHHLYNINTACLRFFTVYGPRQRPDLAIHKFTRLIMSGRAIPFFGDGSTQRDYTYIDDIIDGVVKSIDWVNSEEKRYDIFNLGESETISLSKMVETIESVLRKKAIKDILPMQPGDVIRTNADITKSKRVLTYNPKTNFQTGIENFVKWINVKAR